MTKQRKLETTKTISEPSSIVNIKHLEQIVRSKFVELLSGGGEEGD